MRFSLRKPAAAYNKTPRVLLLVSIVGALVACIATNLPQTAHSQQPAPAASPVLHVYSPDRSIVLSSNTARSAGAIDSLIWGGKEFINSNDHGRMLQYAWQLNPLSVQSNWNPTEAGSGADGSGNSSTSRLLAYNVHGNVLKTASNPANFYPYLVPGTKKKEVVSPELFQKTVTVGLPGLPNVIQFQGVITIPNSQAGLIKSIQVEFPTPYLNGEFNTFFTFNPASQALQQVFPGDNVYAPKGSVIEYPSQYPCIITTSDLNYAMGVYSNMLPEQGFAPNGYAMNNYLINPPLNTTPNSCTKLDMLWYNYNPIPPGNLYFNSYVVVGNLQTVGQQITILHNIFNPGSPTTSNPE